MNLVITALLLPLALATPLQLRQDDDVSVVKTCGTGDLNPGAWQTKRIDTLIADTPDFGRACKLKSFPSAKRLS